MRYNRAIDRMCSLNGQEPIVSVLDSYGPVDRMLIARKNAHAQGGKPTLRRDTLSAPDYKPFSRDEYSLGRYQRASSARLARTFTRVVLIVVGLVAAAAMGAALAALSSGALG